MKPSEPVPTAPEPQVAIGDIQLAPFTTAQGFPTRIVRIGWTNTGTVPIATVFADIVAYDAQGKRLDCSADDYCIFAAGSWDEVIKPGETFTPEGTRGFVLLSWSNNPAKVTRVTATVTRAETSSAILE